jgi:hypothetical protein
MSLNCSNDNCVASNDCIQCWPDNAVVPAPVCCNVFGD